MIISILIKIYIVLVNVVHCYQNLMCLPYAKTPVLFGVDRLPCLGFHVIKVDFVVKKPSIFMSPTIFLSCSFFLISRALPVSPI